MIELRSYRAVGEPAPESLRVTFDAELPGEGETPYVDFYRGLYAEEGRRIANALLASLPGGLVDGILLALLDHKRSILRVPGA